jgi:hypothetical protein
MINMRLRRVQRFVSNFTCARSRQAGRRAVAFLTLPLLPAIIR